MNTEGSNAQTYQQNGETFAELIEEANELWVYGVKDGLNCLDIEESYTAYEDLFCVSLYYGIAELLVLYAFTLPLHFLATLFATRFVVRNKVDVPKTTEKE
jgi:hypothetical protein